MSPRKSRSAPARPTSDPLDTITTPIGMKMKLIQPGEFMMGDEQFNSPLHKVRITRPFYIGVYPITQREWQVVMGSNPSDTKGHDLPVEQVSWEDCQSFIKRLNEIEHNGGYRLPTEAEWEYACRAGSKVRYCFGDEVSELGFYAWYSANSGHKTHPVGKKKPNVWGLYDMHGNVEEWCGDWYNWDYYEECCKQRIIKDPEGPGGGTLRIARGGSWSDTAEYCTAGCRSYHAPNLRNINLGFRLASSSHVMTRPLSNADIRRTKRMIRP